MKNKKTVSKIICSVYHKYRNGFLVFDLKRELSFLGLGSFLNLYFHGKVFEFESFVGGTLCAVESRNFLDEKDSIIVVYIDFEV